MVKLNQFSAWCKKFGPKNSQGTLEGQFLILIAKKFQLFLKKKLFLLSTFFRVVFLENLWLPPMHVVLVQSSVGWFFLGFY